MNKLKIIVVSLLLLNCSEEALTESEILIPVTDIEIYNIELLEGLWQLEVGNSYAEIKIEGNEFNFSNTWYSMEAINSNTVILKGLIRNQYSRLYYKIEVIDDNNIKVYYYGLEDMKDSYYAYYVRV